MGAADRGGAAMRQTLPKELRRTIAAILWRHRNGATWRAIPAKLGPWWLAAQLFIRWAGLGAWERLLELAQDCAGGLERGLAFLDGTSIRAHWTACRTCRAGWSATAACPRTAWARRFGL